ncbi:hypothetical protein BJX68DRAFT_249084 [Aspergillus pseudodeflectus]|uniref:Uncharacterized protein n=1 Tax=Aspergillus pseudodeflectus TaxID=176178 RepID=A0ABR4JE92_9EURO
MGLLPQPFHRRCRSSPCVLLSAPETQIWCHRRATETIGPHRKHALFCCLYVSIDWGRLGLKPVPMALCGSGRSARSWSSLARCDSHLRTSIRRYALLSRAADSPILVQEPNIGRHFSRNLFPQNQRHLGPVLSTRLVPKCPPELPDWLLCTTSPSRTSHDCHRFHQYWPRHHHTPDQHSSTVEWVVFQAIESVGLGIFLSTALLAVLAKSSDTAKATGVWQFVRSFGMVFGSAIPTTIFNSGFDELAEANNEPSFRRQLIGGKT